MERIKIVTGKHCELSVEAHSFRVSSEIIARADAWPWLSDEEKFAVWEGEGPLYISRIVSGLYWHVYLSGFDIESVLYSAKHDRVRFPLDKVFSLFTPKPHMGKPVPDWITNIILTTKGDTLELIKDQLKYPTKIQKPAEYVGSVTNMFFDRSLGMTPVFETLFRSSDQRIYELDIPKFERYSLDAFCFPLKRGRK